MKKLIVTADDFGLTRRVNEAIAIAHSNGIVTTASLMVNGCGFESAVEIAQNYPDLDVGLHLNLTEGSPVSPVAGIPTLASSHAFFYTHPSKLALALGLGTVRLPDVEKEIRAQIEKAIACGLRISHIDGHKHVHAIPAVVQLISRIAPGYGIYGVRCVKEKVPRLRSMLGRNKSSWLQILLQYGFGKVLSTAWAMSSAATQTFRVVTPQRFYGITQTGFLDIETFEDILRDLADGVNEVMCHPGYVDEDLKQTPTRLHSQRERELTLFTMKELRELIQKFGIALVSYRDLLEDYGRRDYDSLLHRYSVI
jgi:hopanoid biosynthesis associated protein HpnK